MLEALGRLCREPDRATSDRAVASARADLAGADAGIAQRLQSWRRCSAGPRRDARTDAARVGRGAGSDHGRAAVGLVLEDLHWSDVSTLDLLSMLARRQEPARLLIIGTYRPVEVLTRDHPLKGIKQELQLHGQCEELALDFLSEEAVGNI